MSGREFQKVQEPQGCRADVMCPWSSVPARCADGCGGDRRLLLFSVAPGGAAASLSPAKEVRCDKQLAAEIQRRLSTSTSRGRAHGMPKAAFLRVDVSDTECRDKILRRIEDLLGFISKHYSEPLSARSLALRTGLTREHLSRMFRRRTGRTISEYIGAVRIAEAASLIRQGEKTEWVASAVGFRNKSSFYRHFRHVFGTTPARMRGDPL